MDLSDFEASLEQATRLPDVWRLMIGFARGVGAVRIAYHHLPPPGSQEAQLTRIENDGFGEALVARYLNARVNGTAVLANFVQNSVRPYYVDELEALADLTPAERENIAFARAAGITNGLGLQVFGPHGRNGVLAIDLAEATPHLAPDDLAGLRSACQSMHLRYCAVLVPELGRLPSLSTREAEVLAWVARGKSNASIGDILGISAHTVDAHLRRIYLKLGVFDRISAALRGLGYGLINVDL